MNSGSTAACRKPTVIMPGSAYSPLPRREDFHPSHDAPRLRLGLRPALLIALCGGVIGAFLLVLAFGSVEIPLDQIITVLFGGEAERASWGNIILKVRLPKALTALLAGAALGAGGLMMQTFFRNPLADPFVLGISSGASLGVALVVLSVGTAGGALLAGFGLAGDFALAGAAALGAALTLGLVIAVAGRFQNPLMLLVLGLMCGYLVSAFVSLLLYNAIPERIQAYTNWTFGSFGSTTLDQIPVMAVPILAGLTAALMLIKALNALLLGEAYARSLGMNLRVIRAGVLLSTALLAGAVTAFCGPIAFIGVAVPHVCRALFHTSDHRLLMPATILLGGIVAMIAALIAETPGSTNTLPLNAVTALLGAPVVIAVIIRQGNLQRSFTS
ncbi:MAG: iron ABC transporter permease [bacterium]|nr:iron ABC transporter permease [bacterium]